MFNAAGGLAGVNVGGSSISNSYALGNVTGGARTWAGGLVGQNGFFVPEGAFGTITNSYASGNVTVTGDQSAAGGLVGSNTPGSTITSSHVEPAWSPASRRRHGWRPGRREPRHHHELLRAGAVTLSIIGATDGLPAALSAKPRRHFGLERDGRGIEHQRRRYAWRICRVQRRHITSSYASGNVTANNRRSPCSADLPAAMLARSRIRMRPATSRPAQQRWRVDLSDRISARSTTRLRKATYPPETTASSADLSASISATINQAFAHRRREAARTALPAAFVGVNLPTSSVPSASSPSPKAATTATIASASARSRSPMRSVPVDRRQRGLAAALCRAQSRRARSGLRRRPCWVGPAARWAASLASNNLAVVPAEPGAAQPTKANCRPAPPPIRTGTCRPPASSPARAAPA